MRSLVRAYCRAPIVLYTGAGVSTGPAELVQGRKFGLPNWLSLLREAAGAKPEETWPGDPWDAADKASDMCGGTDVFKKTLRTMVQQPDNYTPKNGQLRAPFVNNAPTLRSVAAFSGRLTERIFNSNAKPRANVHFRSSANPRLHAVISANYDCFLESGASSIYRKGPLKPVTALGSSAASTTRIPVFHIHGYVPHPFWQQEDRKQAVDRLVVTREDYENVWKKDDVFGTTMGPQIHFLRYYTVLFIGFSFTDEYVNELLRRVNRDYLRHTARTHFALLHEPEVRKRGDRLFSELGVTPIKYSNHEEIPDLLGRLYQAGLVTDRILDEEEPDAPTVLPEVRVKTQELTGRRYRYSHKAVWALMQRCRNERVGFGFVDEQGETLEA
jgi:hypothetical protein